MSDSRKHEDLFERSVQKPQTKILHRKSRTSCTVLKYYSKYFMFTFTPMLFSKHEHVEIPLYYESLFSSFGLTIQSSYQVHHRTVYRWAIYIRKCFKRFNIFSPFYSQTHGDCPLSKRPTLCLDVWPTHYTYKSTHSTHVR